MTDAPSLKYLQIAQELESGIRERHADHERFPSVRQIARDHRVSVVTASRAVQVLRDKGLIKTVSRSGCYPVSPPSPSTARWAVLLRVTPGQWHQAAKSMTMAGFELLAEREGLTLVSDAFVLRKGMTEQDYRSQVRAALDDGIQGLFILPSRVNEAGARQEEIFLNVCRRAGLPAVLIERNLRGDDRPLEYDLVCTDDVGGGAESTRHLIGLGRRRIAFVAGSPTSSHNERIAGYLFALLRAGAAGRGSGGQWAPLVVEQSPTLPAKVAYRELVDRLLAERADGVVCYEDYVAMGLILEFMVRGVRVPQDVALTGFDDLPIGNAFAVGITSYAFPSEEVAREALRVMRQRLKSPLDPPVKVVVPGRLVVRESSVAQGKAAPPRRQRA